MRLPVEITLVDSKEETGLNNFFLNSFNLYCLKLGSSQAIPYSIRKEAVLDKALKIMHNGKYIAAVDPTNHSIFYSFIAYREYEKEVVLYFMYTKKQFRDYGIMHGLLKKFKSLTEGKDLYYFVDVRKARFKFLFDELPNLNFEKGAV